LSLEELALHLPRNAFGPRDTARAGDIWRLCQDAAVLGSARRGWPPERYRSEGCAFVVREMTAVHHRTVSFGEPVVARTWVSTFRRGLFTDRQVRIVASGRPVASATQRWVHVAGPAVQGGTGSSGSGMEVRRASPELEAAFPLVSIEGETDVALPDWEPVAGSPVDRWSFEVWHGWMDPLAHVNHPAYLDWAEEGLSRVLAAAGLDPQGVIPIAEEVRWRQGIVAGEQVTVTSELCGQTDRGIVTRHQVLGPDGDVRAHGTLVRAHQDHGSAALLGAWS
jgi:acyl-CoA thioesterase FadM